jgi:hypothetical protein
MGDEDNVTCLKVIILTLLSNHNRNQSHQATFAQDGIPGSRHEDDSLLGYCAM